LREGFLL
jgi:hypothetical protein